MLLVWSEPRRIFCITVVGHIHVLCRVPIYKLEDKRIHSVFAAKSISARCIITLSASHNYTCIFDIYIYIYFISVAILACVYTFVLTTKLCICVKKIIYIYVYIYIAGLHLLICVKNYMILL